MILYHTADLVWAMKIKGTAEAAGIAARPVRTLEMLEARLADSPVRALIVDLDDPGTAVSLVERVRGKAGSGGDGEGRAAMERGVRVLAFGPHVAVEEFGRARAAGAETVLARGAFANRMPEILARLEGAAG